MAAPAHKTTRSPTSARWGWWVHDWRKVDGKPFIKRVRALQNPLFALLFSRIYRADPDRDPHNHSRPFITIAVTGSYVERLWDDPNDLDTSRIRYHRRWVPYLMRQKAAHQILAIDGKLRTFMLAGRHHWTFYFWTKDGPVDMRDYG